MNILTEELLKIVRILSSSFPGRDDTYFCLLSSCRLISNLSPTTSGASNAEGK